MAMKRRTRKVVRVEKDYGSSRGGSVQPTSALDDSYSRLPTTVAKRSAPPQAISASPTRDMNERPTDPSEDSHFPGLEVVFPRPGSSTGSVHFDCDTEMQTILQETAQYIQSCPLPPLQKVPNSLSEKALLARQPSRGRQRLLPPVGSTAILEVTRNLSGNGLPRTNSHASELLNTSMDISGPRLKPVPRSIVEDYKDRRAPTRQSRSSVRSLEGRKPARLPAVGAKKGRSRGSP